MSTHPFPSDCASLLELLDTRSAVVLTGAGCSTDSGIPDYRGPDGRLRKRTPMRYQEFVRSPTARARYWLRSAVGWPRFRRARPNGVHGALAGLESAGVVRCVLTQNVDELHQAAGSRRVLDLHGALSRVRCLECRATATRDSVQERLQALNPGLQDLLDQGGEGTVRPDGDVDLPAGLERDLRVPACTGCGGVLKPDVVFFGENVPAQRVERAWSLYREAGILLVLGSSLTVYSGRRFVLQAAAEGKPVAIVNRGATRGDEHAAVKVDGAVGPVMERVADALGLSGERRPRPEPRPGSPPPAPRPGWRRGGAA